MSQTSWFGAPDKGSPDPKYEKQEPEVPSEVTVEAQTSGKRYRVDVVGETCTCATPTKPCFHIKRARDLHVGKARSGRFEFVSAMHKEVRRGDVGAALYWADLLSRYSDWYVKNYVRKVVGEETRNWKLFMMALEPGDLTYRDLVAAIAGSRKKWEHKAVCKLFKEQLRAYNRDPLSGMTANELVGSLMQSIGRDDVSGVYDAWAKIEETEDASLVERMDHVLIEAATRRHPTMVSFSDAMKFWTLYEKFTHQDVWEARVGLVEAICGGWDESMNDFHHDDGTRFEFADGRLIKRVPPYAFDSHMRQGRKRVEEADAEGTIAPGRPMPDGLDLRWSGQLRGVAWRYAAYVQHGDRYVDARWEDVKMTAEFWEKAWAFERYVRDSDKGDDDA